MKFKSIQFAIEKASKTEHGSFPVTLEGLVDFSIITYLERDKSNSNTWKLHKRIETTLKDHTSKINITFYEQSNKKWLNKILKTMEKACLNELPVLVSGTLFTSEDGYHYIVGDTFEKIP